MNYTENYRLPQWNKSDRVLMEDFNQAMHKLDEGLANAVDSAAQAAEAASAAANAAQSTADTALRTANNAFCSDYMPYVVGSYVGNEGSITIQLGFKPSFAIISYQKAFTMTSSTVSSTHGVAVVGPNGGMDDLVRLTSTGMVITHVLSMYPHLNSPGTKYCYIAFR